MPVGGSHGVATRAKKLELQVKDTQDGMLKLADQFMKAQDDLTRRMTQQENVMERLTDMLASLQAKNNKEPYSRQESHEDYDDIRSTHSIDSLGRQERGIPKNFDYSQVEKLPQAASLEDYRIWRKNWEYNARAKNLAYYPRQSQVASLISAIGQHGSDILEYNLGMELKDPKNSVEEMLDALQRFFRNERNLAVDRQAFYTRRQLQGETFREYYHAMEKLSRNANVNRNCDSEECRKDTLVTMLMLGVTNEAARKKMMKIRPFPKLDEAVTVCTSEECAEENAQRLIEPSAINKVSTYKRHKQDTIAEKWKKEKQCYNCGGPYDAKHKPMCPAKGYTCKICGKIGHFDKMCHHSGTKTQIVQDSREKASQQNQIGSIVCTLMDQERIEDTPFCHLDTISVRVFDEDGNDKGCLENVLPDTGAAANLMSVKICTKVQGVHLNLKKYTDHIYGANGSRINTLGRHTYYVQVGDKKAKVNFVITDQYDGIILNRETCKVLGLIPSYFPQQVPCIGAVGRTVIGEYDKNSIINEFQDVFHRGELKPMKGEPMHIEIMDDAKPFQVNGPRPIPIPLRANAKKLIYEMVEQGILAEVTEPTEWLHPFTVVVKPGGGLRLCVDLRMLNKFVKRPQHPARTPKDAVSMIPPESKYFTVFDAKSGYFQILLDEESQLLTTFITPYGRFKHTRATMGLSCAGDEFNRRTDTALAGLPNVEKVVDDIIIHGTDLESHLGDVRRFLLRCREEGITLNPKKVKLAEQSVKFAGYIVSDKGIQADPEKLKAITHYPKPTNITDLRSFLGLVEQLAGFSKDVAGAMQPLRPLLSKNSEFYWTADHDRAFDETKTLLSQPPVLTTFDPGRKTMLQTDASRTKGLGYALLQLDNNDRWRLVEANSRFISDTEFRYAMVEMELLAVKWAMQKCHIYLFGLEHFYVVVDHLPLLSILNKQTLDCVENTRLQRLKAATGAYNFTAIWRKGKEHRIPDALSRAPVNEPTAEDLEDDLEIYNQVSYGQRKTIYNIMHEDDDNSMIDIALADPMLEEVRQHSLNDTEYQEIRRYLAKEGGDVSANIHMYKTVLDEISQDNQLLMKGHRIIIPKTLRKEILKRLHSSHQGIDRTLRRARQTVYWPGITADVKSTVRACEACMRYSPSQAKEPLQRDPLPTRIFEEVAADLCEYKNEYYLVVVDRYSGWPEMYRFNVCPSSEAIVKTLVKYFTNYGCPNRIFTDGGRQFVSQETEDFLKRWGVAHRVSSPNYPQSNGLAEAAVKSCKSLLKKCGGVNNDFLEGYLELKNTPGSGGKSPAEVVFGHPLRTRIPMNHRGFDKSWLVSLEERDAKTKELAKKVMERYNISARKLPQLKIGDNVVIQDPQTKLWDKTGTILSKGDHNNYRIKFLSGRCLWRNRKFLKPFEQRLMEFPKDEGKSTGVKEIVPRRSLRTKRQTQRFTP